MNIVSKVSIKIGDYEFKPPKTAKRMVMERGDDQSQTKLRHLRAAGPVMTKFKKKKIARWILYNAREAKSQPKKKRCHGAWTTDKRPPNPRTSQKLKTWNLHSRPVTTISQTRKRNTFEPIHWGGEPKIQHNSTIEPALRANGHQILSVS